MSEVLGGASSRRGAAHATAPPEQDLCRSRPMYEETYKIPPWTTRMRPQSHSPPAMSNWSGTFCTQTTMSESSVSWFPCNLPKMASNLPTPNISGPNGRKTSYPRFKIPSPPSSCPPRTAPMPSAPISPSTLVLHSRITPGLWWPQSRTSPPLDPT